MNANNNHGGAFYGVGSFSQSGIKVYGGTSTGYSDVNTFSANEDAYSYGNPMKNHAIATDSDGGIRPFNISMIPIIIVS